MMASKEARLRERVESRKPTPAPAKTSDKRKMSPQARGLPLTSKEGVHAAERKER